MIASDLFLVDLPILCGWALASALSYWIGKKIQGFLYKHSGRMLLTLVYSLPLFVAIFLFLITMASAVVSEVFNFSEGQLLVLSFKGMFLLPFACLFFMVASVLLLENARKLRYLAVPKTHGAKHFFFLIPAFVLVPTFLLFIFGVLTV